MKRYSKDLGERVHGLNLLCGANLQDDELRIAIREIDSDDPKNMYKHAKNALKKYFGKSAITGKGLKTSRDFISIIPKQETLFFSVDEYESYIAWKKDRNNQKFSSDSKNSSFYEKKNPNGSDGKPLKCHVCQSTGHFVKDCPNKYRNDKLENRSDSPNRTWAAQIQTSDIYKCDTLDIYVAESLNYMILDTGCPKNVAGWVWFHCFIEAIYSLFSTINL